MWRLRTTYTSMPQKKVCISESCAVHFFKFCTNGFFWQVIATFSACFFPFCLSAIFAQPVRFGTTWSILKSVLRIRICRIHMFSASWIRIRILLSSSKNSKQKLDLWLLYGFLSLKNYLNIPSKIRSRKTYNNIILCWRLEGQWRK